MGRRLVLAALCTLALAAASASVASAQTLKYRFGPIQVAPGQNTIDFKPNNLRPQVPGYITAFRPNLTYLNGKVPGVDVVHLHHGVWLVNLLPTWAAGEEKTDAELPAGYGWRYEPSDTWVMNYMVHNLTPTPTQVYLTYEIDFTPGTDPSAAALKTVSTKWMDVESGHVYPVFDALRSASEKGRYTYPTDDPNAYQADGRRLNTWTAYQDGTLVWTAGHLHPGGLHTDLYLTRDGRTTRVFRSNAHYFEPAGAVSWDVAMTNTPADWRVQVKRGDTLTVTGTYDTSKASWYESMAIMPVAFSAGDTTGVDPFSGQLNTKGVLNHGHLAENDNHGGGAGGLPDARGLPGGILITGSGKPVFVQDFQYGIGDLTRLGRAGNPPTVRQGRSITFNNLDDGKAIWHTITACKAPCNGRTGIAYPLANATVDFDSGELGTGPPGRTAAANRLTWKTPSNLKPGTYTYFCRIHPFMRGSFRVVPR
jgi:plastocyanin